MSYYETEAIVLSSFPLAEADKVVTFLTPHYGVLRGVASGSRNIKSRFAGTLEPFSNISITFSYKERELVKIEKAELKKSYFYLVSKPSLLPFFAFIAETLVNLIPQGAQEEKAYRMVKACLETTDSLKTLDSSGSHKRIKLIKLYFGIWMLKLSGYLPAWTYCRKCKKSFADENLEIFISGFNVFCESCRKGIKVLKVLKKKHLRVLYLALSLSPQEFIESVEGRFWKEANHLHEVIEQLLRSAGKE